MSSAVFRAPSSTTGWDARDVLGTIASRAGPLPQITLEYDGAARLLWVDLRPEPKPVMTLPMIESTGRLQEAVMDLWGTDSDRPIKYLAYRSSGKVFSIGGDLDFYLDCLRSDPRSLRHYAEVAIRVSRLNRNGLNGAVITLINIHGKAVGGGIDAGRACNVMIAEEGATFSYPEVEYNHFPIQAVPILSRHTGPIEAERILLSGAEFTAEEFHKRGAIDAVVPVGTGQAWIRDYALRTAASHAARVAVMRAFDADQSGHALSMNGYAETWAEHMLGLAPTEIARLQRIASTQERMLARMYRQG